MMLQFAYFLPGDSVRRNAAIPGARVIHFGQVEEEEAFKRTWGHRAERTNRQITGRTDVKQ